MRIEDAITECCKKNCLILNDNNTGIMVGKCLGCMKNVARINPETGDAEWLDGKPFAAEEELRKIE